MLKIKTTVEIQVDPITAYVVNKKMLTYNCERGEWWGNNVSKGLDLNEHLQSISHDLPNGEYEIQLIIKKV